MQFAAINDPSADSRHLPNGNVQYIYNVLYSRWKFLMKVCNFLTFKNTMTFRKFNYKKVISQSSPAVLENIIFEMSQKENFHIQ